VAVYAIVRFPDSGGVVALDVKPGGEFKYIPWAEFNAIPTPLAPIFEYIYNTGGNMDFF
jgi:hypothetical protein